LRREARAHVLVLLLTVVTGLQVAVAVKDSLLPLAARVAQVRSMPSLERSARLAFGDAFWQYVDFIRHTVPGEATVIIPPESVDVALGNEGIVQYYLFPRTVANCPWAEPLEPCILRLTGPDSYILAIGDFPPPSAAGQVKDFLPFDDARGIYVPRYVP